MATASHAPAPEPVFACLQARVWRIELPWVIAGKYIPVNSYLLQSFDRDDHWTLIDTGLPVHFERLRMAVRATIGRTGILTHIFVTHGHRDHMGGLHGLLEEFPTARAVIHEAEREFVMGTQRFKDLRGVSLCSLFQCCKCVMTELTADERVGPEFSDRVDCLQGPSNQVGEFRVFHTPGHTPGSICIYSAVHQVVCVGDQCMIGTPICCGSLRVLGPAPLSTPDLQTAFATFGRVLAELSADVVVLPGHDAGPRLLTVDAVRRCMELRGRW